MAVADGCGDFVDDAVRMQEEVWRCALAENRVWHGR